MPASLVNVRYRGIDIAAGAELDAVHGREAFVALAQPMPVGTRLELRPQAAPEVAVLVEVISVRELAVNAAPVGMLIRPTLREAAERAWWQGLGGETDTPAALDHLHDVEDDGKATMIAAVDPELVAKYEAGAEHTADDTVEPPRGKGKRKKRRG